MKVTLISTAVGFTLMGGMAAALAEDIIIAPEQETVIREYVKKGATGFDQAARSRIERWFIGSR
jgi:hypothetical protein